MDIFQYAPKQLYFHEWTTNRIRFLTNHYGDILRDAETLTNMAAHEGDLSYLLQLRFPHLRIHNEEKDETFIGTGFEKHGEFDWSWQHIDYTKYDLDTLRPSDIVINFGLFYHLSPTKARETLLRSIHRARLAVFFESETLDCDNEVCFEIWPPTQGKIKASIPYINQIIEETGCRYEFIDSEELDSGTHCYSWPVENTKKFTTGHRKMWVIWK